MMNIAVMSDLHVGLAARSKDLCPEPPPTSRKNRLKYKTKSDDSYQQKFLRFVREESISADYLFLPGDITNKAKAREVKIASEFILRAADALGVSQEKIVFVPGNHDVNWAAFEPDDDTGVSWEQRYNHIGHNSFHFKKIIDNGQGSVLSPPHFTAWGFDDLLVIGYNSASHDSPVPEDQAHHGLADPDHLDSIRTNLENIGPPDDRLRFFVVHHHLLDFSEPIATDADFSLMTNAESLLTLLHEFGFDLLIHGHKHQPRFETHSTQSYPHIPVLCSGSFSVEIDTQWAGTINNQFHLITVNCRESETSYITGKITSWTNNHSRGWIPSEESTSGIHHIIPFGSYVMPQELDARLEPFITQWLTNHDHILWRQVVDEFPDLEYLPLGSAIAAFKRMEQRLDRQSMYQNCKDLILY